MTDRIAELAEYFEAQDDIALAILFGSYGTAAERPDSDVDVAVLRQWVPARAGPLLVDRGMSIDRRMAIITALATRTGRAIDLIDMASAGIPILGALLTTGRTLVARDPDLRPTLLVRYLIDAADFMPYYERTLRERRAAWIG